MARFSEGQRVRVAHDPNSPVVWWGRIGVITFLQPLENSEVLDDGVTEPLEQQYKVRLDGDRGEQFFWETWLDPL